MREIRQSGSEGGGTELNRSFLPLSGSATARHNSQGCLAVGSGLNDLSTFAERDVCIPPDA